MIILGKKNFIYGKWMFKERTKHSYDIKNIIKSIWDFNFNIKSFPILM